MTDGADTYVTGSNVVTATWRHWRGPSRISESAEGSAGWWPFTSRRTPRLEKKRSQFTHHEEMNVRADELAHAITPDMPLYASFRRPVTGKTTLWYQPMEYENVGRGAMYEVTGNAYKHITLTSQRRASTRRQLLKDGEMLATHVRMSTGRTMFGGPSNRVAKPIHQQLPTDARIELWAGR